MKQNKIVISAATIVIVITMTILVLSAGCVEQKKLSTEENLYYQSQQGSVVTVAHIEGTISEVIVNNDPIGYKVRLTDGRRLVFVSGEYDFTGYIPTAIFYNIITADTTQGRGLTIGKSYRWTLKKYGTLERPSDRYWLLDSVAEIT